MKNHKIAIIFIASFIGMCYSQQALWHSYLARRPVLDNADACLGAINREPANAQYHLSLGLAYSRLGRHDEAKTQFERALKLDITNSHIYFMAGDIHLSLGNKQEAYKNFNESIRLSESHEKDILNKVFKSSGQYEELEKVVPQDAEKKFILAKFLDEKDLWKEAKKEFQEALKLKPPLPYSAYAYFGSRSVKRKDYDNSIKIWQEYLKGRPNNIYALRSLAYAYLLKKDYSNSEKFYLNVLAINADDIETLNQLGWLYYQIRDAARALRHYKDIIDSHKFNAGTCAYIAKVYFYEKKFELALENYKKSLNIDPKAVWVRYEMALSYFYLGRYNQATLHYRECLENQPNNFYFLKYCAMALEKNGDFDEALAMYKKAGKIQIEDEFVRGAIKRIEEERTK